MSRCYPFPPPGYEKKARADDVDLLKKEKHKEKKHKKEKRDKETREGKERREKDRRDGECRDKKDRKEKHRDKKKDKEKEKEKDKEKTSSTSGEKRIAVQNENCDGEKFYQSEKNHNRDKSNISNEKKQASQFQIPDREKPIQNTLLVEEISDSKLVQELDRRTRDEHRGAGRQLVQRFSAADRKQDEAMDKFLVKDVRTLAEGKDKRVENKNMGVQGIREEAGFSGSAMAQNTAGVVQNRIEEIAKSIEKKTERRMEGKEKSRDKEDNEKRGDKQQGKNREKKSQAKVKDGDKERQVEKMERNENKFLEEDKFKDSNKNNLIATSNIKNLYFTQEQGKGAVADGNPKKRNNPHVNGFLHDGDIRSNKLPRQSSHLSTENGRKLEPCQTSVHLTSDRQGAASNLSHKEHKLNGIAEVQPSLSISSMKTSSVIREADWISETSKKPAHRDSKYLSQVLSVPKMNEWIDFDDQEWLFGRNAPASEKLGVGSVGANRTPWVWSEALQIESADTCALPYVVPF